MALCLAEECIIIGLHEGKRGGERERGIDGTTGGEREGREWGDQREAEIKSRTKTERFSLSITPEIYPYTFQIDQLHKEEKFLPCNR